jgi:drug/metabolite transporter (DMT)-like permease
MTSLLMMTESAITVLIAHVFLQDEVLNRHKWSGVLLTFGGETFLLIPRESGLAELEKASPLGYGLVTLAMMSNSGMTIIARKYLRHFDSLNVTIIRLWVGALVLMPLYAFSATTEFNRVDNGGLPALLSHRCRELFVVLY